MAEVTYTLNMPATVNATMQAKMTRLSVPGIGTVLLPWWPDDISWNNLSATWEEYARPGQKPLLLRTGAQLVRVSITCSVFGIPTVVTTVNPVSGIVTATTTYESVQPVLDGLLAMAANTQKRPVNALFGSRQFNCNITDLSWKETRWTDDGSPAAVDVSLELTEASTFAMPRGPVKAKPRGGRHGNG